MFEGDFWGETVPEFSHSLGRKRPLISVVFEQIERPLSGKADIGLILTKGAANDPKRTCQKYTLNGILHRIAAGQCPVGLQ